MAPQDPYAPGPPGGQSPVQPYPGRPPRRRRTIIVAGIVAAVVIVAAGAGAYVLLSGGGESSSPEQVARDTAQAVSKGDVAALRDLACDASTVNQDDIAPGEGVKFQVEVSGDPKINGSKAEVPVNLKVDYSQSPDRQGTGLPPTVAVKGSLKLTETDGDWCADMTKPIGPGQN